MSGNGTHFPLTGQDTAPTWPRQRIILLGHRRGGYCALDRLIVSDCINGGDSFFEFIDVNNSGERFLAYGLVSIQSGIV